MKKELGILFAIMFILVSISGIGFVKAASSGCNLKVSLVNQDPSPAVQGDSVKLLFQVSGVQNLDCNGAVFKLDPGYSFSLTQNDSLRVLGGSTFTQNYKNDWNIPYTLKVNPNALDGNANIDAYYAPGQNPSVSMFSKTFNVSIQDSRARFEVYVKNYDPTTKDLTLQVLNTAKVNVKSLTLEIPNQPNLTLEGANVNIVGDLDSNDYTTADFQAVPKTGNITVNLAYTDIAGIRRTAQANVSYDSKYFEGAGTSQSSSPLVTWIIVIVIVGLIIFWFFRRNKKRKALMKSKK